MHIILVGGFAALITGLATPFVLDGSIGYWLPLRLRGYQLFLLTPVFMLCGLTVGASLQRGSRSTITFAMCAALPGYLHPLLLVASQGIHRPMDQLMALLVLPCAAYMAMGMLGGLSARLGVRRSLGVGIAFGAGIGVAALIGRVTSPGFHAGTALIIGTPWITGSGLLSWLSRSLDAQNMDRRLHGD